MRQCVFGVLNLKLFLINAGLLIESISSWMVGHSETDPLQAELTLLIPGLVWRQAVGALLGSG